jgi:hypothetical protein
MKYTQLYTSYRQGNLSIEKVKKAGTQRTFFIIVNNQTNKVAHRIAFARLYDAKAQIKKMVLC